MGCLGGELRVSRNKNKNSNAMIGPFTNYQVLSPFCLVVSVMKCTCFSYFQFLVEHPHSVLCNH